MSAFGTFEHDVVLCHILEDASTLCCDLLWCGIPIETLVACILEVPSWYFGLDSSYGD